MDKVSKQFDAVTRPRVALLSLVLFATLAATASAQSSGNFTASYDKTECAINETDRTLSGGIASGSLPDVTIKVSSGNGTALVITPSLVTGLYSRARVSASATSSTQSIGLRVKVAVDGSTANVVPELGSEGVIYDQRFIKVSASFLAGLATCSGDCFELVHSTLSAHSFNFYVSNLPTGTHTVRVSWEIVGGRGGEAACVGPGTVTVQQVKNFSFNSRIDL
jgi:hypothetical protein